MLDIKDKVDSNLFIAIRGLGSFPKILECLVLMELGHLQGSRILPLGVSIALVKLKSMVIISWDLITILVSWGAVGMEFGLIGHAEELLLPSCNTLKVLPAIKIKQVVLFSIDGTSDRVISSND